MSGLLELAVGTDKQFKIDLANKIIQGSFIDEQIAISFGKTESGVSETPTSIDEAIQGAKNRSVVILENNPNAHFGVGLEGGIHKEDEHVYLIEAAAISINMGGGQYYTEAAIATPVQLPPEIIETLEQDVFLSIATQKYLKSKGLDVSIEDIQKNGTTFYLTNPPTTRNEMMASALASALEKLDKGLNARNVDHKLLDGVIKDK